MRRTIWFCDVCGGQMPDQFTIIAWDLCPSCIEMTREFLRGQQADHQHEVAVDLTTTRA